MTDDWADDAAAAARVLEALSEIASQAAAAILALRSPSIEWTAKSDASPVTAADRAAQDVIVGALTRLLPGLPIVSEEAERHDAPDGKRFALVDPLDGTKEFISGREDFTVNIALIAAGVPLLGVVGAPAMGMLWRGVVGSGAERLRLAPGAAPEDAVEHVRIRARPAPQEGLTAAVSRSHPDPATEAFLSRLSLHECIEAGSAVKFCRLAEGRADVYPRFGTTCEWDIAAGHAVVMAAGGIVAAPDGSSLSYGHAERNFRVPGFIAWGDPASARFA